MTNERKDIIAWVAIVVIGLAIIVFFIAKKDSKAPVVGVNNTTTSNNFNPNENSTTTGNITHTQQSNIIPIGNIPSKAVKLTITSKGFSPSSFTVKPGEQVVLSVTSGDNETHVLVFYSKTLSSVAVGVGPKETRLIKFDAPTKAGIYKFHCDVPGHTQRGEIGSMIVK